MRTGLRLGLCLVLSVVCCGWATAQAQPVLGSASNNGSASQGATAVTLGQAVIPLYGPWKFKIGDSPLDPVTHTPLWAEPGFDDSQWENVDLTPKEGAVQFISGQAGYVPGWAARGHAGYSGYAWYRLRVFVQIPSTETLALEGPPDVDDGYELFANGTRVGGFGNFNGRIPVTYYNVPMMFDLPGSRQGKAGFTPHLLAFRVWMNPVEIDLDPDAGGLHNAPLLGTVAAVTARYQLRWVELVRSYASWVIEALVFALLAGLSFSLILFDRTDRVYLWMGALYLLEALYYAEGAFSSWTQHLSMFADQILVNGVENPLLNVGWLMVWWLWFGRPRPHWLPRAAAALVVIDSVVEMAGNDLFYPIVPHPVAIVADRVSGIVFLLCLLGTAWIVIQGIRSQGREGWLVIPALVLCGVGNFSTQLEFLNVQQIWHPFGVSIAVPALADVALAGVLAVLLLRRMLLSVRRQRLMALDVKQAQEVQQVILPETHTITPNLTIESEYRPAREVGGDFFQVIPHPSDGSLLIVAGDVTGKGLKAGMLVALLVGAIRSTAELNPDPLTVLDALNRRLRGRGEAHATCLALSIDRNGQVTLANAGHLAPYLNAEPVAMEGALPLGMIDRPEFSVMRFALQPGDKLVLVSDGVAEATDAEGGLFGFERTHEMLRSARSAAEIAAAAQAFGQEDDISVVTVTYTGSAEPSGLNNTAIAGEAVSILTSQAAQTAG
ncbi:MAG: SpoIIE family protein phosphatase [Acidobacteriota bacterium]